MGRYLPKITRCICTFCEVVLSPFYRGGKSTDCQSVVSAGNMLEKQILRSIPDLLNLKLEIEQALQGILMHTKSLRTCQWQTRW